MIWKGISSDVRSWSIYKIQLDQFGIYEVLNLIPQSPTVVSRMAHLAQMVITLERWVIVFWLVDFSRNLKVDQIISLKSGQDLTEGNRNPYELSFSELVILLHWLLNWWINQTRIRLKRDLLDGLMTG